MTGARDLKNIQCFHSAEYGDPLFQALPLEQEATGYTRQKNKEVMCQQRVSYLEEKTSGGCQQRQYLLEALTNMPERSTRGRRG